MKTSDHWYTSIDSTESPLEQADQYSRASQSPPSESISMAKARRQRANVLPLFVGSALISGCSLLGLIIFLVTTTPSRVGPIPQPEAEVIRE